MTLVFLVGIVMIFTNMDFFISSPLIKLDSAYLDNYNYTLIDQFNNTVIHYHSNTPPNKHTNTQPQ